MTDISSLTNTRVVLKSRPMGMPTDENFDIQSIPVSAPGSDEMLLRTLWLSLDPYMRGRMSDRKSYAKPLEIGDVITGGAVDRAPKHICREQNSGFQRLDKWKRPLVLLVVIFHCTTIINERVVY